MAFSEDELVVIINALILNQISYTIFKMKLEFDVVNKIEMGYGRFKKLSFNASLKF